MYSGRICVFLVIFLTAHSSVIAETCINPRAVDINYMGISDEEYHPIMEGKNYVRKTHTLLDFTLECDNKLQESYELLSTSEVDDVENGRAPGYYSVKRVTVKDSENTARFRVSSSEPLYGRSHHTIRLLDRGSFDKFHDAQSEGLSYEPPAVVTVRFLGDLGYIIDEEKPRFPMIWLILGAIGLWYFWKK